MGHAAILYIICQRDIFRRIYGMPTPFTNYYDVSLVKLRNCCTSSELSENMPYGGASARQTQKLHVVTLIA